MAKWEELRATGHCFNCKGKGHLACNCPKPPEAQSTVLYHTNDGGLDHPEDDLPNDHFTYNSTDEDSATDNQLPFGNSLQLSGANIVVDGESSDTMLTHQT